MRDRELETFVAQGFSLGSEDKLPQQICTLRVGTKALLSTSVMGKDGSRCAVYIHSGKVGQMQV